jgi:DNA primase
LLEYIHSHETDFIRFKTQLLIKDTENDPVARARLINDIVKSISVIPDTITRSVYIRECSHMLEVAEDILYTEVRKIKFKITEEQIVREKRDAIRSSQELGQSTKPVVKNENPCAIEEKALLRILIRYHNQDLFTVENDETGEEEKVKVGQYILSEIENDNLSSVDPAIQLVFDELREHINEEFFNPERHFVQHENREVGNLVSGLLVDKYIESVIWKRKGAFVEDEHEILNVLVPRLIEEYKLRHVKLMKTEIMKKIGEITDPDNMEKVMELQSIITNLNKVERELSKKLGKRAVTS